MDAPAAQPSSNVAFHKGERVLLDRATVGRPGQQLEDMRRKFQSALESSERLVGLDMEWKPDYSKERSNKVALIQLALGGSVWLVRTCEIDLPDFVRQLLLDSSVVKVVADLDSSDRDKLQTSFGIQVPKNPEQAGFVDISLLARECGFAGSGVKKLCERYGLPIEKNKKVSCSNWAAARLTEEQLQYASDDAFFTLLLGGRLLQEEKVSPSRLRSRARAACDLVLPVAGLSVGTKDMTGRHAEVSAFWEELNEAISRACAAQGVAKIPVRALGQLRDRVGMPFAHRASLLLVPLGARFLKEQCQLFGVSKQDLVWARSAAERAPFTDEEKSLEWASAPAQSLQTWLSLQPRMAKHELSGRLGLLARAFEGAKESAKAVAVRKQACEFSASAADSDLQQGPPRRGQAAGSAAGLLPSRNTKIVECRSRPLRKKSDSQTVVARGIPKQ
mmetsp:Transcript_100935/g.140251  ORF Transcript_100935/g.140251 Transcript_100935/m.140251 type:complete len:447 (+) Transcript_100935:80-1420(+)|eukprot:s4600_g5.t1